MRESRSKHHNCDGQTTFRIASNLKRESQLRAEQKRNDLTLMVEDKKKEVFVPALANILIGQMEKPEHIVHKKFSVPASLGRFSAGLAVLLAAFAG